MTEGIFEEHSSLEKGRAPEPMNGEETARLVERVYDAAGSLGPRLVESNIVLTLAGARGQTEFEIVNPSVQSKEEIARLDTLLREEGIRMYTTKEYTGPDGKASLSVNIDSLRGYERNSKTTKIPGIPAFDRLAGWEGRKRWQNQALEGLERERKKGTLKCDERELLGIFVGVIKGYPDQAVLDLAQATGEDRENILKNLTAIPHARKYEGSYPDFHFSTEHANEPDTQHTIALWGGILQDFYESDAHKKLSSREDFIEARSKVEELK